jgi:hypothetical protein
MFTLCLQKLARYAQRRQNCTIPRVFLVPRHLSQEKSTRWWREWHAATWDHEVEAVMTVCGVVCVFVESGETMWKSETVYWADLPILQQRPRASLGTAFILTDAGTGSM